MDVCVRDAVIKTGDSQPNVSADMSVTRKPGYAQIKQEYLIPDYRPTLHAEYLSSDMKVKLESVSSDSVRHPDNQDQQSSADEDDDDDEVNGSEPPQKKAKLKGRNKHRPRNEKMQAKEKICPAIKDNRECRYGDKCKFSHNKEDFISKKVPDLEGPCYNYDTFGYCHYGVACRFAKNHLTEDLQNIKNEELFNKMKDHKPLNELSFDVRNKLWKKKYDFKRADRIVKDIQKNFRGKEGVSGVDNTCSANTEGGVIKEQNSIPRNDINDSSCSQNVSNVTNKAEDLNPTGNSFSCDQLLAKEKSELTAHSTETEINVELSTVTGGTEKSYEQSSHGCITDEDVIHLRPQEKKKIDFKNKLYLAPLTTVGNLPFRRICKGFGADVTCGEMALVTQLLKGKQSEWSLIKRHASEDLFGVQICGSYPDTMTRCAQLLTETCNVDFIDINCGCPIDLIYRKGGGSALLGKATKLEQICRSMIGVMGDTPLTVKLRTGVFDNKNVAHQILPRLRDAGVSLVTIHGRSREQRYTKQADWDYISQTAAAASPMPVFGNGDILSYEELNYHKHNHRVNGVMIARGALIKPWIFTEIKEQRHWDISAGERFDILKTYTNYGLEHWGSDHQGVENTRRFLLEWLSFLHRYIPVGVLEQVPQRINEKPPYYIGRNDLETLMSSASCADWIKISEMLLGPVPVNFQFLPKHKANAYQ